MSFFEEIRNIFINTFNSFKNEIIQEIILIKNSPNDREKELEEINTELREEIILLRQELEILRLETSCKIIPNEVSNNFLKSTDDEILCNLTKKSKKKIVRIHPWELFNTNTVIKFNIMNGHMATIDVINKEITFRNTNFTSLSSIITSIKYIENINPNSQFCAYNFVDWYDKKTKTWISASDTFTKDFLEKNGKQN